MAKKKTTNERGVKWLRTRVESLQRAWDENQAEADISDALISGLEAKLKVTAKDQQTIKRLTKQRTEYREAMNRQMCIAGDRLNDTHALEAKLKTAEEQVRRLEDDGKAAARRQNVLAEVIDAHVAFILEFGNGKRCATPRRPTSAKEKHDGE